MMTLNVRRLLQVLLGAAAGLFAWPTMEALTRAMRFFPDYLSYTAFSGLVFGLVFGAALGGAEGIAAARARRVASGSLWGGAAGAAGGAVGFLLGQALLFFAGGIFVDDLRVLESVAAPLARSAGWAVLGIFSGAAAGIQSSSARKCAVGALGGLLGGLFGGAVVEFGRILFPASEAVRASSLVVFGAVVGLAFAAVEKRLCFGVLRVLNGPLKGREFLLNQRLTRIGEDPRCDVCVAGYRGAAPLHAFVSRRGRDLTAESAGGAVSVNEDPVRDAPRVLKYDDVIACGGIKFLLRRE